MRFIGLIGLLFVLSFKYNIVNNITGLYPVKLQSAELVHTFSNV